MSDDGWGESPTPAAKPVAASSSFGGQSGFGGSTGFGAVKNASGDAQPAAGSFGGQSKGFGNMPAATENKGFGGPGFGSAAPKPGGFSSVAPAPTENKGFGSAAPKTGGFSSVAPAAPKAAGFSSVARATTGFGNPSSTTSTSAFGGAVSNGGFSNRPAAAPAGGFGGPPATTGGFGGLTASTGFGKSSGGASSGSGFGASTLGAGFGTSTGGAGFGSGAGGSGFGAVVGGAGFGSGSGGSGFGGASRGFGGGADAGGRPRGCFNCGEEGHRSSECPQPKKERSSGCFNCGEEGHRSSDCTQPRKERPVSCFNCGEEGHRSSDCTQPRKERPSGCFNCGQEGHSRADCTEPPKPREDGAKPASTFIPPEESPDTLYHSGIEKGMMFERFFDAPVTTMHGGMESEKPKLFQTFEDLGLGEKMFQNIVQCGFTKPTPVQQHAMPIIMSGHDLLACAQTGSGKTGAFLLPVMSKLHKESDHSSSADIVCSPRCVVIAPTRELAVQISNEARKFAYGTMMTCKVVYGGTHVGHQRNQLIQGATIVVGTVGRLKQFIDDGTISLKEIRYLILDEADRMLDMGFEEDIKKIVSGMPDKKERQTLMFSATFPSEVQLAARDLLKEDYVMFTVDAIGAANKCITQELIQCDRTEKKDKLLELLEIDKQKYTVSKQADIFTKKTLIFVSKKAFADTLGAIVSTAGIPATTIHGDRLQNERHEALTDFTSGRKAILIATSVAERGLDIKGVDHVINFDLPEEMDSYVHRIGRTGRVGNSGRATSFYNPSNDQKLAAGLMKCMEDAGQVVPDWLKTEAEGSGIVVTEAGSGFGGAAVPAAADEEEW